MDTSSDRDADKVDILSEDNGSKPDDVCCFGGFKVQSSSPTDLQNKSTRGALVKFLNFFRPKSDPSTNSSKSRSSSTSSKSSVTSNTSKSRPRKRFVRVARDSAAGDPCKVNDNPHVICRYSQDYLNQYYRQTKSEAAVKSLPYVTSGHTILKKSSTDPTPCLESDNSPMIGKHATFKDVVQVIEYVGQEKGDEIHCSHEEQLQDNCSKSSKFFLNTNGGVEDDAGWEASEEDNSSEAKIQRLNSDSEKDVTPLPHIDLDRMDGIMRNIFSAVVTVQTDEAGGVSEPLKCLKRVELSELVKNVEADDAS